MADANERLLYEHLGESALSYLLNLDMSSVRLRFENPNANRMSQTQELVLGQLIVADSQIGGWRQGQFPEVEWASKLAGRPSTDAQTSVGNLIRQQAGGNVESVPGGLSGIEAILAQLAIEVYPGLLVNESDEPAGRAGVLPVHLFRHSLNDQFQLLAQKDRDLKKLFYRTSETTGPGGSTLRSTGQGGDHQLWTFAETIIRSGWDLALLESVDPSISKFIDAVLSALKVIRLSVNGKDTYIPARVGLTGVLLPEGVDEIDLGQIRIRRADVRDEKFIGSTTLEGQLSTVDKDGRSITINYSGDLVVELEVPFRMLIGVLKPTYPWPETMKISFQAVEEAIENIRLGLLLALPDRRIVLHTSWRVMIDPYSQFHNAGWNWDIKRATGLMPTQLTSGEVDSWSEWASKITKHRIPGIGVAIRRMLASVAERRTAEDVMVDAVIVWENLFGAKTETALRVTSSLAWLVGTSAEDRMTRQSNYKKIYGLRSDVVHGAAKVNQTVIEEKSLEAVGISIEALRAIFDVRPELLKIGSSEERSLNILHSGEHKADS